MRITPEQKAKIVELGQFGAERWLAGAPRVSADNVLRALAKKGLLVTRAYKGIDEFRLSASGREELGRIAAEQ